MRKPSNWFFRTILEEDEEGESGVQKIMDMRRSIMKIVAVTWMWILVMAFTLPLVIRFALTVPLF